MIGDGELVRARRGRLGEADRDPIELRFDGNGRRRHVVELGSIESQSFRVEDDLRCRPRDVRVDRDATGEAEMLGIGVERQIVMRGPDVGRQDLPVLSDGHAG